MHSMKTRIPSLNPNGPKYIKTLHKQPKTSHSKSASLMSAKTKFNPQQPPVEWEPTIRLTHLDVATI